MVKVVPLDDGIEMLESRFESFFCVADVAQKKSSDSVDLFRCFF